MRRIENTLEHGFPDCYWCCADGRAGLAELKISTTKTKITVRYPAHQRVWARKHIESGGNHLLIVHDRPNQRVLWYRGMGAVDPENHEPFHTGYNFPKL